MELKTITRRLSELKQVRHLYQTAFPADERAPFRLLLKKGKRENIDFLALYDNGRFVGLVYLIRWKDLVYLFYLAIDEPLRRQGYGKQILSLIQQRYPRHRIFLAMEEMDPSAENYNQRLARRDFYASAGLTPNGQKIREFSVVYDLVSNGTRILPMEYKTMMNEYLGLIRFLGKVEILPETCKPR